MIAIGGVIMSIRRLMGSVTNLSEWESLLVFSIARTSRPPAIDRKNVDAARASCRILMFRFVESAENGARFDGAGVLRATEFWPPALPHGVCPVTAPEGGRPPCHQAHGYCIPKKVPGL